MSIFASLEHLISDGPGERSRGRAEEGGISTGSQVLALGETICINSSKVNGG